MVKQIALEREIFADSMLETSPAQRSRRSLSTLTSFAIEAVVVGLAILLSILKTVVMPVVQTVSTPIFAGRSRPVQVVSAEPHSSHARAPVVADVGIHFMQPPHGPIDMSPDTQTSSPEPPGLDGGIYGDRLAVENIPTSLLGGDRVVIPPAPKPVTKVVRTSSMLEGSLLKRVQPVYPRLAHDARIQGTVVLAALISREGTIENLHLISGHPMLVQAAIDAVQQWRYRPYILNNEPIEVETQITVNFTLSGN